MPRGQTCTRPAGEMNEIGDFGTGGHIKWFGPTWRAPLCEAEHEVPTPVGENCLLCHEPVREGQRGVELVFSSACGDDRYMPQHLDCFLRSVGISDGPVRTP